MVLHLALHGRDNVRWHTHAIFAVVLGAIIGYIVGSDLTPRFFVMVIVSSILPDIAERAFYETHKRQLHNIFLLIPCAIIYFFYDITVGAALTAGIMSHILLDCLTPVGCPLLMPFSRIRFSVRWRYNDARAREKRILAAGVLFALLAVLVIAAQGTSISAISAWAGREGAYVNSTYPGFHVSISNPQKDMWFHSFPNGSVFIDVIDSVNPSRGHYRARLVRPAALVRSGNRPLNNASNNTTQSAGTGENGTG